MLRLRFQHGGKQFGPTSYVDNGMKVVAPYQHKGKLTGLLCVVECAAGNHARVVNELRDFSRWFHIGDLRVEKESHGD